MGVLSWLAVGLSMVALVFIATSVVAFRRKRILGSSMALLLGLLLLSMGALSGTIAVATQGYHAFTREALAVTVVTRPTADQEFEAALTFPDGRREVFRLAGDQVYLDAHVLKWKPLANILGLHTAYELDRIGGRYLDLEDEEGRPRTLYSLKAPKPADMFTLRQRFAVFRPLLDAEYGSATFVAVASPATYEVTVSTTGLLIREVAPR